jgi:uncharacterized protein YjaZ
MELLPIETFTGLRTALSAPPAARLDHFRALVMEPLRPFWQPFLAMPWAARAEPQDDPALAAARVFGYYSPEQDVTAGLAALDRLDAAGSWAACLATLRDGWAALAPEARGIALKQVRYSLILGNPEKLDARLEHYTGVGGWPGLVQVVVWPTAYNVPRLPAATVHELHHNVRFSYEPFIPQEVTVGQYIVAEGLAEAFAAERCGEALIGPWATYLPAAELEAILPRFGAALETREFDAARAYIFGDWAAAQQGYVARDIPDFAGYSVGYHVVRAFLARSGLSAAEATYLPWREITAGSGVFPPAE